MQAFSTPKSREWSGVTAQQAVVNGNCPSIKCNYCDKVFAGNAGRIRAHYLKCPACPSPLRDYCKELQTKAEVRRADKSIVVNMQQMLETEEKQAVQQSIDKAMNSVKKSAEICDEAFARCVYNTMQSFSFGDEYDVKKMLATIRDLALRTVPRAAKEDPAAQTRAR